MPLGCDVSQQARCNSLLIITFHFFLAFSSNESVEILDVAASWLFWYLSAAPPCCIRGVSHPTMLGDFCDVCFSAPQLCACLRFHHHVLCLLRTGNLGELTSQACKRLKINEHFRTFCAFLTTSDHNVDPHLVVISSLPFSDDCFLLISTMSSRPSPFPSLRCLSLFDFDLSIEISMCPLGGPATLAFCCIFPICPMVLLEFRQLLDEWDNGMCVFFWSAFCSKNSQGNFW